MFSLPVSGLCHYLCMPCHIDLKVFYIRFRIFYRYLNTDILMVMLKSFQYLLLFSSKNLFLHWAWSYLFLRHWEIRFSALTVWLKPPPPFFLHMRQYHKLPFTLVHCWQPWKVSTVKEWIGNLISCVKLLCCVWVCRNQSVC